MAEVKIPSIPEEEKLKMMIKANSADIVVPLVAVIERFGADGETLMRKLRSDGGFQYAKKLREDFNIKGTDAFSAYIPDIVAGDLFGMKYEIKEKTDERVVHHWLNYPLWEVMKEMKIENPGRYCEINCTSLVEGMIKVANPKLTLKSLDTYRKAILTANLSLNLRRNS